MPDPAAQYYFRFRICWRHCLQKVKVYQQTKFRRHDRFTAATWLLMFLKNKRSPYRNSTSGFNLDHIAVICMLFCIRLPELVTTAFISCYPLSRVYLCSSGTLNAYMSFQSVTITFTNVLLFYVISFSVLIDCLLIYCVVFIVFYCVLIHCFFSITFWWRLSVSY